MPKAGKPGNWEHYYRRPPGKEPFGEADRNALLWIGTLFAIAVLVTGVIYLKDHPHLLGG